MLKTILLTCMLGVGQIVNAQKAPQLNVVATTSERNWNGIAVSNDNRLFANFPRFDKASDNPSLVEIKDGGKENSMTRTSMIIRLRVPEEVWRTVCRD